MTPLEGIGLGHGHTGQETTSSLPYHLSLGFLQYNPLPHLLNPEAITGGWLTVFSLYFLGTGLAWTMVSLIDGTTSKGD
jgi:hypothetical protein